MNTNISSDKVSGMDWISISEIVTGLVLNGKISETSVYPDIFFPPYSDIIKLVKIGKYKIEDIIERVGLSPVQASFDAAGSITLSVDVDWIGILKNSCVLYQTGKEMEKVARNLQRGTPADIKGTQENLMTLMKSSCDVDQPRYVIRNTKDVFSQREKIPFVIDELFKQGTVSVIAGEGGSAKTYLLLCAAISVALGKDFLNLQTSQCPVLYVNEEISETSFTDRVEYVLHGLDGDENTPFNYINMAGLNLLDDSDLLLLEREIKNTASKFIIIDALSDVMPGGDENSSKDMTKMFLGLRKIASMNKVTFVVIHHKNKQGGYRGSSDIVNKPDNLWEIDYDGKTCEFKLIPKKIRDGKPKKYFGKVNFVFDQEELSKVYVTASTPEKQTYKRLSASEEEVYNIVLRYKQISVPDIKSYVESCSEEAARKAVYTLAEKGLITRINKGKQGAKAIYAPFEMEEESLSMTEAEVEISFN